jgi:hypothetical protein
MSEDEFDELCDELRRIADRVEGHGAVVLPEEAMLPMRRWDRALEAGDLRAFVKAANDLVEVVLAAPRIEEDS